MSRKRRRIKGMGSVYTRKDGRVVGEYAVNGKTRYIYGKDEAEVANRVAEAIKNRDVGIDSENMTVGGYLDKWLAAIKDTVRIGTWKQYEMIVRIHIKPTHGNNKLDKLNALQVQAFYRERLDAGLSARRAQYAHVTIHKALKDAVRWRLGICSFHKNSWKPLLKRAGLPHARVHDLRHTAATLMLSRGVPIKVVSEMLGHADVITTVSIYAHVLPDIQGGAASAMDDLLS